MVKKFDVVTFGSSTVDVFVNTDVSKRKGMISYPIGSKILIEDLKFDWGGGGTNTAVAFSRLGLKTGFIGKIGNDENGRKILDSLKKEKISFLGSKVEGKSGYSVILDSKNEDRTILTHKGLNDNLSIREIKISKMNTGWLYYSSLLGKSFKTQKDLAKKLVKKGTKLAFNPSEYLIKEKNINPLLKITEVLILNKEEAQLILKKRKGRVEELLEKLYRKGPNTVVITNKDKEVKAYDGNKFYSIVPNKKIKVVERTGAGDAFASGFVAGIIAEKNIDQCLKIGKDESESVIRYFGSKNKLLKRKLK